MKQPLTAFTTERKNQQLSATQPSPSSLNSSPSRGKSFGERHFPGKRNILIAVICLVVVSGIAVVILKARKIAALPKPQAIPPAVQVAPAAKGSLEITAHYLGSIEPFTRSDLSARISGNILSIAKREGDTVRQGEEVIVMDEGELTDHCTAVDAEVLATGPKLAGTKSA